MEADQARQVLEELHRRAGHSPLYLSLFPEQREFVEDSSMLLAALTDRRAGKSNAVGAKLYNSAEKYPGSICPYIALTYWSAENIIWPVIKQMNSRFWLGMNLKEASLEAELPNGSKIPLMGANTKDFMEKLRGPKYPIVGIDEAASFKSHLKPMVEEILLPAVSDYDGQICLVGTPGPIPSGYFFDITTKKMGWNVHKWSWRNNPYLPNQAKFVQKMMELQGWTENNPTYRREWCGEWVTDSDALVYRFSRDKNVYREMPKDHEWFRVMGIDFGYNDATAFSILSYSPKSPKVFIEYVEGQSRMIPSKIAERTIQLQKRFDPYLIVADTGGLGKSICEEMIQRYGLPIKPAEKREKLTNISLLNGDFVDENLWVHASQTHLMDQYETLSKDDNGMEDPALPNDLCDAVLYAYRACKAYAMQVEVAKVHRDTDEWAKNYWEREAEKLERSQTDPFFEADNNGGEGNLW